MAVGLSAQILAVAAPAFIFKTGAAEMVITTLLVGGVQLPTPVPVRVRVTEPEVISAAVGV